MDSYEAIYGDIQDHIMANTWRLIFEHRSRPGATGPDRSHPADLGKLVELLPEYRQIGRYLVECQRVVRPT